MKELLEILKVIDWFANDVHYTSIGPSFYELHKLADKVRDFGEADDDIKECYFLGQLNTTPPCDVDVSKGAVERYEYISANYDTPLQRLKMAIILLVSHIEELRKDTTFSGGINSILDDISKRALRYRYLVSSQLERIDKQD